MSALAKLVERFSPDAGTRRIGPIGLEFALHAMHMVQLEPGRDGRVVVRARATSGPAPRSQDLPQLDRGLRLFADPGVGAR